MNRAGLPGQDGESVRRRIVRGGKSEVRYRSTEDTVPRAVHLPRRPYWNQVTRSRRCVENTVLELNKGGYHVVIVDRFPVSGVFRIVTIGVTMAMSPTTRFMVEPVR